MVVCSVQSVRSELRFREPSTKERGKTAGKPGKTPGSRASFRCEFRYLRIIRNCEAHRESQSPPPGADSPEMPPILARKGGRVKEPDNYNIPSVITAVAF